MQMISSRTIPFLNDQTPALGARGAVSRRALRFHTLFVRRPVTVKTQRENCQARNARCTHLAQSGIPGRRILQLGPTARRRGTGFLRSLENCCGANQNVRSHCSRHAQQALRSAHNARTAVRDNFRIAGRSDRPAQRHRIGRHRSRSTNPPCPEQRPTKFSSA
jgi:hypothetical protein